MKKYVIIIIIAVLVLDTFINQREINEIAIASCIGIDLTEDGMYDVTINVLNTKKSSSKSSESNTEEEISKVHIYESIDKSIQYALRNIISKTPKKLYLGHVKLVLLSEKIAKENLIDTLDYFIKDYEGGNTFMLAVVKDIKPKKLMEELSKNSDDFTEDIVDSIKSSHRFRGNTTDDILNDNLRNMLEEGCELALNTIEVTHESNEENEDKKEEKSMLKVSNMAYFKDNMFQGYFESEYDNICYNLLKDDISTTLIGLSDGKNRVVLEMTGYSLNMKPVIEEGKCSVIVNSKMKCNITETGADILIDTDEDIEKIRKEAEEHVKNYIEKFIYNCKYIYKSDVVGFGKLFYRHKYKEYNHEKFYNEIYNNLDVKVTVDIKIQNTGGVKTVDKS